MANNLFNQLNKTQTNLSQIRQMLNNPNAMMNNPQMQQVMNFVRQNGGDAKSLFYQKANEMGVDPNTILNKLR